MRPRIKVAYCGFWADFNPHENYFTRLLSPHYELVVSKEPDYLIYSCFGKEFRNYRCTRIYFTGENTRPNFRQCDYAFTFDHCDRLEHYRLPLYALYGDVASLVKQNIDPERLLAKKTGFCNFVFSNRKCKTRIKFFEKLSKYKRVDSGGRLLNNIGGPVKDKLEFISRYKFTIAFENSSFPGYTTEKIFEPMQMGSLPIYWGNPLVHLDFNPRSFLNFFDYSSLDALVERVVEIDRNDELYCSYVRQPWYHGNHVNEYVQPERVLEQFHRIFAADKRPVAQCGFFARRTNWSSRRRAAA
jgi:alpha(1,3/1,4) fucosyltransferase